MPEDVTPPDFKPQGIRFDKTITMGNLLTLVGGMIAAIGAYADYRVNFDRHETRITNTESRIIEISTRMTEESKARAETTRALDHLTTVLETEAIDRKQSNK